MLACGRLLDAVDDLHVHGVAVDERPQPFTDGRDVDRPRRIVQFEMHGQRAVLTLPDPEPLDVGVFMFEERIEPRGMQMSSGEGHDEIVVAAGDVGQNREAAVGRLQRLIGHVRNGISQEWEGRVVQHADHNVEPSVVARQRLHDVQVFANAQQPVRAFEGRQSAFRGTVFGDGGDLESALHRLHEVRERRLAGHHHEFKAVAIEAGRFGLSRQQCQRPAVAVDRLWPKLCDLFEIAPQVVAAQVVGRQSQPVAQSILDGLTDLRQSSGKARQK